MLIGTQQNPPDLLEIPTGLAALGMTEVVVSWLRRFQQSDKLKFETIDEKRPPGIPGGRCCVYQALTVGPLTG